MEHGVINVAFNTLHMKMSILGKSLVSYPANDFLICFAHLESRFLLIERAQMLHLKAALGRLRAILSFVSVVFFLSVLAQSSDRFYRIYNTDRRATEKPWILAFMHSASRQKTRQHTTADQTHLSCQPEDFRASTG